MKTRTPNGWLTRVASHWLVVAAVAVILVAVLMRVLHSQSISQGVGQGRTSKPGEIQSGPKAEEPASASKMEPARRPAPVPVLGREEKMEEHLARGSVPVEGKKQEPVNVALAMKPPQGKGQQQKRAEGPPGKVEVPPEAPQSHLRLVLRVTEGLTPEVVSATELDGPAVLSDAPTGDFLSEVVSQGRTIAVQALPDPFEIHSFGGPPGTPYEKHHFERVKTATILVDVPRTGLETNLEGLALRFYKIKPGPNLERINPEVLQKLKEENRLDMRIEVPGSLLAPGVRLKGKKLAE